MTDIQDFLFKQFVEKYCAMTLSERKEFLSLFLNDDKNCVLYVKLQDWVYDALNIIIPNAPESFIFAVKRSIDYNDMRDDIFNFIESEGDLTIADEEAE